MVEMVVISLVVVYTSFNTAIKMTHFQALSGFPPSNMENHINLKIHCLKHNYKQL